MQWRVRGGSSATRAQRKQERERWSRQPIVRTLAPRAAEAPAADVVPEKPKP